MKHFFEPVLFFLLLRKKRTGSISQEKKEGSGTYRCPKIFSETFSLQPSVAPIPTTRKVSALCASPFGDTCVTRPVSSQLPAIIKIACGA